MATKDKKEDTTKATAMTAPEANTALAEVDFGDDAGSGYENVSNADLIIPLIVIVQSNAKLAKDKVCEAGLLWNTSTQQGASQLEIIPAVTDHCYLEWVPRDDGGGFRGRHALSSEIVKTALAKSTQKIGKHPVYVKDGTGALVKKGTELVEAFEIWCIIGDGNGKPIGYALISCTSTKIRPYRNLVTRLRGFQVPRPGGGKQDVPLFANRTLVRVVEEKNKKGEFFNYSFDAFTKGTGDVSDLQASMLSPKHPMYIAGKELRNLVAEGKVAADYASTEDDSGDGHAAGGNEAADTAF